MKFWGQLIGVFFTVFILFLFVTQSASALIFIPGNSGSAGSAGNAGQCYDDGEDPCETWPAFYCNPSLGAPNAPYCNTSNWSLTYPASCSICLGREEGVCTFSYNYNYYTCSAVDRCYGATGPASGYDAAGRVSAGICSASSFDGTNPNSACITGGIYKQCCSAGGYAPATACQNGVCPGGTISSPGVTSCGTPPPTAPRVQSASPSCNGTSAQLTFSYIGGDNATRQELRYSANSPSLNLTVNMGSTPWTLSGFSPGNRIYYNIYACNAAGCTPDPNGYYYVDLPSSCGAPPVNTPTPTTPSGYVCNGTCGTSTSPQGQACGGGGSWQWDGQPSAASTTCRTNPNTYCYVCVPPGATPTPTPAVPTPTSVSGSFICDGPGSIPVNTFANFTAIGGSGSYNWSAPGGNPSGVSGGTSGFTTRYASTGNYTVTVSNGARSANCFITVGTSGAGWSMSSSPVCSGTSSVISTNYTIPSGQTGQLCYTTSTAFGSPCVTWTSNLTGTGTNVTNALTPNRVYYVWLQIPGGAVQQGPTAVTTRTCTPPTCSGPSPASPVDAGSTVQYTAGGGAGAGSYSWVFYAPTGGPFGGGTPNPFPLSVGVPGTYQVQVSSGGLTTACNPVVARVPVTCTGITSSPNPMVAGTSNTITMAYSGPATSFNWGTLAGSCSSTSGTCSNYGLTSSVCSPTTVSISGASVSSSGGSAACPATSITMNPRHSVSGNIYVDFGGNTCSSGSAAASGMSPTLTLNNTSASITSTSITGNSYLLTDTTNFCGANNRSVTMSTLPPGYSVVGYRRASSGAFTPLTGFTTPFFTYSSGAVEQLDWCLSPASAWFQTTSGDVRYPSLSNLLPASSIRASSSLTSPSIFFSSLTNPTFGAGAASSLNWQVGREYQYNNDFQQGLGSSSYTFYLSQARKKNIPVNTVGATTIDPSVLESGIYRATAANVTISSCNTISSTRHIVILVDNSATLQAPSASGCSLYPSSSVKVANGGLFVLAAKGNITVDSGVGTSAVDDTNTQLDGFYTAEGSINFATRKDCGAGTSDFRLNIGGAIVANALRPFSTSGAGRVVNNRSLCVANATSPTFKVYMRPDFITQLTDFYKSTYKTFREVNP